MSAQVDFASKTVVSTRCCADCGGGFSAPWGETVEELVGGHSWVRVGSPPPPAGRGRGCPEATAEGHGTHSTKCSLARISFKPGVFSRRHLHPEPTVEIFYVLEGSGVVEVSGATKRVAVGDTVYVPSGAAHQIGTPADSSGLVLLVTCTPAWEPTSENEHLRRVATQMKRQLDGARYLRRRSPSPV